MAAAHGCDIRVEVVYTMMEAYDRLARGDLKVEEEKVLLDIRWTSVEIREGGVAIVRERQGEGVHVRGKAHELHGCNPVLQHHPFRMSEDVRPGTPCLWGDH
jgi:hypothetical protein